MGAELSGAAKNKILIVEDHPATANYLAQFINDAFPGATLEIASSAEIAVSLCKAEKPRLVVMDISLPGLNGIEAARQIKSISPSIQVVMHSSFDDQAHQLKCREVGADAFVSKTCSDIELIPAIAALLSVPLDACADSQVT